MAQVEDEHDASRKKAARKPVNIDLNLIRIMYTGCRRVGAAQELDEGPGETEGVSPGAISRPVDSGIMKWPTSAVCSGPPLGQSELLVWTERGLRTGAGVGLESQGGALRADSPGV